jgi:hypothetical protein
VRSIPPALQAKLDSGVTTLARCWIITRRDGIVMGFTDHDADITVAGRALADESLAESDLAAGRYDAASIEVHLVDWSEPSLSHLLSKGVLGEVRREGAAFTAELRSLAHRLNEESGRLYTATCSADLGDARCGVDLTDPALHGSGTVASLAGASLPAVRARAAEPASMRVAQMARDVTDAVRKQRKTREPRHDERCEGRR